MSEYAKVAIVIDYQNVHMSARDIFMRSRPTHESLIDPLRFSNRIISLKNKDIKISNDRNGTNYPQYVLSRVEVYRGIPLQEADRDGYRRNLMQQAAWKKSANLPNLSFSVCYRTLKYKYHKAVINGKYQIDTNFPPQEKGVDVLCALALTRLTRSNEYEAVVLASRDTDLIPALDEAHSYANETHVEAAKWYSKKVPQTGGSLRVSDWKLWTTSMDEQDFKASLDPRDYS